MKNKFTAAVFASTLILSLLGAMIYCIPMVFANSSVVALVSGAFTLPGGTEKLVENIYFDDESISVSFSLDEVFFTDTEISSQIDDKETTQLPDNVLEVDLSSDGSSGKILDIGSGYLKNCTVLGYSDILSIISSNPPFVTSDGPEVQVLIYHTHTTEAFIETQGYRTTDSSSNMVAVGDAITAQLEEAGIGVVHDTTLHDHPSYTGSYERSLVTIENYTEKYPGIKMVLDIHRDAIEYSDGTKVKPTAVIDGESAAQIMIIVGADDGTGILPNFEDNLVFAALLQNQMEDMYPGLTRPILFDYRVYNQFTAPGAILCEIGSHANTTSEAIYSGELLGNSLVEVIKSLK